MITKVIVSEQERCFINTIAVIVGDDEHEVQTEAEEKFRQLIREDNEELTNEEIDKFIEEECYYNAKEGKEFGIYLQSPDQLLEV